MKRCGIPLAIAALLVPAASHAIAVPLPIHDATLNLDIQLQPWFLVNEAGAPDGTSPSYDIFLRRVRLSLGGDIAKQFSWFFQLDNANFGKYGNNSGRVAVQDAWFGWAPTGIEGGTVVYVDAGLLYIPISRHYLTSTTNYITADVQTDGFRIPGNTFLAFRDVGVQVRGWALDKRIGFRAGVHEGMTPFLQPAGACATGGAGCITPRRNPAFGALVNFDLIGSEEGTFLYSTYRWKTTPVLSVSVAGNYQSLAVTNGFGNLSDQRLLTTGLYLDLPASESQELVVDATLYLNRNGSGSPNTGTGFSAAVGYRYGLIAPYVAYDYFQSSGCDPDGITPAQLDACNLSVNGANSRNFKAGVNVFFNRNLNHLNLEFGINHGLSAFGPSSITAATAGYVPASLDPIVPGGPRRPFSNSLANPSFKSVLLAWTMYL